MKILNLTQHAATPEQIEGGVVDLPAETAQRLASLLTFDRIPNPVDMVIRAEAIALIAEAAPGNTDQDAPGFTAVMIGGAPFFMPALTEILDRHGMMVLCAFSRRESAEERTPDGGVRKVAVFRHLGFVDARPAKFRDGPDFEEISRMADDILSSAVPPESVFSGM